MLEWTEKAYVILLHYHYPIRG